MGFYARYKSEQELKKLFSRTSNADAIMRAVAYYCIQNPALKIMDTTQIYGVLDESFGKNGVRVPYSGGSDNVIISEVVSDIDRCLASIPPFERPMVALSCLHTEFPQIFKDELREELSVLASIEEDPSEIEDIVFTLNAETGAVRKEDVDKFREFNDRTLSDMHVNIVPDVRIGRVLDENCIRYVTTDSGAIHFEVTDDEGVYCLVTVAVDSDERIDLIVTPLCIYEDAEFLDSCGIVETNLSRIEREILPDLRSAYRFFDYGIVSMVMRNIDRKSFLKNMLAICFEMFRTTIAIDEMIECIDEYIVS